MEYCLARGILLEQVGEEFVASLPSGDMAVLNGSAAVALQALEASADDQLGAVAASLSAAYGIPDEQACVDAKKAIARLRSAGVVVPERISPRPKPSFCESLGRRAFVAGAISAGLSALGCETAFGEEFAEGFAGNDGQRMWTDSLGRRVCIPEQVTSVAPYGPYAQSLIESIDPEMVVQVSARGMHASFAASAFDEAQDLRAEAPGEASLSVAALEDKLPDFVLDVAVGEDFLCRDIESQAWSADVPVVHLVVPPGQLPAAYVALGSLLGREERCRELSDFVASIDAFLDELRDLVPEDGTRTVYFGEGRDGLSSRRRETLIGSLIEAVGGRVFDCGLSDSGASNVPLGILLEYAPDVAVLNIPDYYIGKGASEAVDAVWGSGFLGRVAKVFVVPQEPVSWLGSAPLIAQTVGAIWLAKVVYPELVTSDVNSFIEECFGFMFGIGVPDFASFFVVPDESGSEKEDCDVL